MGARASRAGSSASRPSRCLRRTVHLGFRSGTHTVTRTCSISASVAACGSKDRRRSAKRAIANKCGPSQTYSLIALRCGEGVEVAPVADLVVLHGDNKLLKRWAIDAASADPSGQIRRRRRIDLGRVGVFRWPSEDREAQSLIGEPFGRRAAQAESRSRVGHPGTTVRRNPALCPMPAIAARSTTRPVAPNTRRSLGRSPVRGASQDATSHRARGSRPDSRWGLSLERFQRGGSSCRLVPSGRLCRASRPFGPSRGVPRLCFPGSPERSPRECGAASEELRRPFVEREPTRSGLAPETPT